MAKKRKLHPSPPSDSIYNKKPRPESYPFDTVSGEQTGAGNEQQRQAPLRVQALPAQSATSEPILKDSIYGQNGPQSVAASVTAASLTVSTLRNPLVSTSMSMGKLSARQFQKKTKRRRTQKSNSRVANRAQNPSEGKARLAVNFLKVIHQEDDDIEFDKIDEVTAYLLGVSTEANGLPRSRQGIGAGDCQATASGVEDERSLVSEENARDPALSGEGPPVVTPYLANGVYLLSTFTSLRGKIRSVPEANLQGVRRWQYDLKSPLVEKAAQQHWRRWRTAPPNPAALARMSVNTILNMLQLLSGVIEKPHNIPKNTSIWILGLLAALPTSFRLSTEDHSILRALGKAATTALQNFVCTMESASSPMQALNGTASVNINQGSDGLSDKSIHIEEVPAGEKLGSTVPGTDEGTSDCIFDDGKSRDEELGKVKAQAIRQLRDMAGAESDQDNDHNMAKRGEDTAVASNTFVSADAPDENTVMTLEMILFVVGAVYGHRDLLSLSPLWKWDIQ